MLPILVTLATGRTHGSAPTNNTTDLPNRDIDVNGRCQQLDSLKHDSGSGRGDFPTSGGLLRLAGSCVKGIVE